MVHNLPVGWKHLFTFAALNKARSLLQPPKQNPEQRASLVIGKEQNTYMHVYHIWSYVWPPKQNTEQHILANDRARSKHQMRRLSPNKIMLVVLVTSKQIFCSTLRGTEASEHAKQCSRPAVQYIGSYINHIMGQM